MPPPAVHLPPGARRTPSRNSRTARRRRAPVSDGASPMAGVPPGDGGAGRLDVVGGEAERAHDGSRSARGREAAEAEGGSGRKRGRGAGHAAGEGRSGNEGDAEARGEGQSDVSRFLRSWVWKREGKPDVDRFDRPYMHVIARPFCTLHPDHCHPPPPHPSHPPAAPHQVFAASPASAPECACEQQRVVTIAQQRFGPLGFASTVWDSSIVAGKYFERHAHLVRSKTCIELGAGCGLLGISLAVLGARAVVLTDMPGNLPLLHRNVHANDLHHTVHVKALTWGSAQDACALPTPAAAAAAEPPTLAQAPPTTPSTEPPRGNPSTKQPHSRAAAVPCASGGPPTFDLVVATDVVYDHGAIAPLVDTLAMLCGPRTSVFIAHGRNRQALAEFLRRVGERFRVREVAWEEMHETYRCEDVQMMELTLHQ